jgi:hypothetical protein
VEAADIEDVSLTGAALLTEPKDHSPDSWLGTTLSMLVQATSVWSRFDTAHVNRTAMKELNRRLGTKYHQELTPLGLKNQRKRDGEFRQWRAAQDHAER